MALDATQVRVATTGNIYKAPVGTTMPIDVVTALPAAWVDLGYTETGPSLSTDVNKESFTPWQSQFPVRETVTTQKITAKFNLWQRNTLSLQLAFGGGTVTGTTVKIFTPPASATVNEGAFVFEIRDGLLIDRWCIARAAIVLDGDIPLAKDAPTAFGIDLTYLQPATGSAWTLVSNDLTALV